MKALCKLTRPGKMSSGSEDALPKPSHTAEGSIQHNGKLAFEEPSIVRAEYLRRIRRRNYIIACNIALVASLVIVVCIAFALRLESSCKGPACKMTGDQLASGWARTCNETTAADTAMPKAADGIKPTPVTWSLPQELPKSNPSKNKTDGEVDSHRNVSGGTDCVPVQTCTDVDLLGSASPSYLDNINLSTELLEGTICEVERDLYPKKDHQSWCSKVSFRNTTTIQIDVHGSSSRVKTDLLFNIINSTQNPPKKVSAVYTGMNLPGIGQYRIEFHYEDNGFSVRETRRFLRLPGAVEFVAFPLIQKKCIFSNRCGEEVHPSLNGGLPAVPPTLLPAGVVVPRPTKRQFINAITSIYKSHCSCI